MGGSEGNFSELTFDDVASSSAVLRVYRQVFAVLARQSEAMISDPSLLDVDQAILEAFADSGSDGMTLEQVRNACRQFSEHDVDRRFEVLRDYGAISKVVDRSHERRHRAAFAPYVMLLFLRRMAKQGGQSELHQLLAFAHQNLQEPSTGLDTALETMRQLTQVFRLIANELQILSIGGTVEQLRENAVLLWGNRELIERAHSTHNVVLDRWPQLDSECRELRIALAAYGDAIDAAAGRLLDRAGTTRALGLLPTEAWVTFAKTAEEDRLAAVLDTFMFDAPTPWFDPQEIAEAVASGRRQVTVSLPPPRSASDLSVAPFDDRPRVLEQLRQTAEGALRDRDEVSIIELLESAGDWPTVRRLLADLTAAHQADGLPYELTWADGLRIDPETCPSWVSEGRFRRTVRLGRA
jgi:hypothetical protein